ncbi:MAG: HpcH/HpaI aldolase/citrate lyase family protein [Pseudomonadota bacterium]
MDGKTVIHPRQIGPVNAAFSPSKAAIADAQRVVDAMASAARDGRSVATLDGRMVEARHARAAEALLANAAAITAQDTP